MIFFLYLTSELLSLVFQHHMVSPVSGGGIFKMTTLLYELHASSCIVVILHVNSLVNNLIKESHARLIYIVCVIVVEKSN